MTANYYRNNNVYGQKAMGMNMSVIGSSREGITYNYSRLSSAWEQANWISPSSLSQITNITTSGNVTDKLYGAFMGAPQDSNSFDFQFYGGSDTGVYSVANGVQMVLSV